MNIDRTTAIQNKRFEKQLAALEMDKMKRSEWMLVIEKIQTDKMHIN